MLFSPSMPYRSLANENLLDVLRLIRTGNVGPVTFFQLISRFGTAAKALEALPHLAKAGGKKTPLVAFPKEAVEHELEAATKFGARFIVYGSPDYPALLHMINDPPPVITVSGHSHLWQNRDLIAIVGARNASANGCQMAQKLAHDLSENGLSVVSGLARGIDTYAHRGSLLKGTIGVIAGGINNIYPPENAPLFQQMRETGAIISEQPFGALPFAGSFPGRNRIIAGMSLGTVVVEAALKSGSLITARFAGESNREVLAVPGSPADPRSKGCNMLIRQGAHLVESAADVLQAIASLRNRSFAETPPPGYTTETPPAIDTSELEKARPYAHEKLGFTAVSVDELIEQCEAPAHLVLTILLELELAGRLRRGNGNRVYLLQQEEFA